MIPAFPQPVNETALYHDGEVTVTGTRLQVGATTYPIRGIVAVSLVPETGGRTLADIVRPVVGLIFAVGVIVFGAPVAGSFVMALSMWVLYRALRKPASPGRVVRIETAAGPRDAFTTADERRAQAVVTAINQAMAGG